MPLKQTNLCEFCNFLNWSFNFVDGSHWHYDKLFLKWFGMVKFSIIKEEPKEIPIKTKIDLRN